MIKKYVSIFTLLTVIFLTGCAEILQSVELKIDSQDKTKQDEFDVVERTLTLKEATKSRDLPYNRRVITQGSGGKARHITEKVVIFCFSPTDKTAEYKIGKGDTTSFIRLVIISKKTLLKIVGGLQLVTKPRTS